MRYFLELSYRGTDYHGWQTQPNARAVQAEVERALSTLLQRPTPVVAGGRTDTGVHARQQFVHFDHTLPPASGQLLRALN
ncbi:MAG: tRNA pseudouridine(38-40) synthase TruA, partial [Catalinimonas sp.]